MKNLEWLKEEALEGAMNVAKTSYIPDYRHGYSDAVKHFRGLIDQVEQPDYNDIFDKGYKDGYKTAKNQTPEQPMLQVIPGFVAEYIEECKVRKLPLFSAMESSYKENDKVARYLFNVMGESKVTRQELFARAWLDGYRVEEKKRYEVRLPSGEGFDSDYALMDVHGRIWNDAYPSKYQLTEDEIKKIDPRYMAFAKEVME